MSHHSCTSLLLSNVTCMIVHSLIDFQLCFACALLMIFFAIDEIADTFGFAGHRLFDDVLIAIICIGDGGIEQP